MRFLKANLLTGLNCIAGIASVAGILLFIFSDKTNAIIALTALFVFLAIILAIILIAIVQFLKKEHNSDCIKSCVFTTFETLDSTRCVFETYRVIQNKRLILNNVDQNFKWSGSKMPIISSECQSVKSIISNDSNHYDKAILQFKRPLLYNEIGLTHFKAELDDHDNKAKPHLDFRVDSVIPVVHYRVILRHKPETFNKSAKFLRKPIDSKTPLEYIEIGSIPFDAITKSYTYNLIDPEPGYYYRILWEK
ncbi:hypothetical protein [Bacteroides sp. 519]|uniref:hypothetical protein n=1 Tax=Bacteroides sp. 519 TaxID=2302937 RepID=UPI0013D400B2|nr:hypothetical protein [Bacteroides sp. 519]NDV57882.1 hypothetical protein [Bacteroides sp. 519]